MHRYKPSLKLLILLIFTFYSYSSFGDNCAGKTLFNEPGCGTGCLSPETCEPSDDAPEQFCCLDVTSVPELPSWFGPFFLATAVAAWEYVRVRRKRAPAKSRSRS